MRMRSRTVEYDSPTAPCSSTSRPGSAGRAARKTDRLGK
jgi:hypothetical protein